MTILMNDFCGFSLSANFHQLGPLGRIGQRVDMSVCLCVFLTPSHAIFLRGRTGAERSLSVDWCDLDLDLDLHLE